jgi:hypothetical protein
MGACGAEEMAVYALQHVQLKTGSQDRDGRLIFTDGELIAVIVLLADQSHGSDRGLWNLEAYFRSYRPQAPLFASPRDAVTWLHRFEANVDFA